MQRLALHPFFSWQRSLETGTMEGSWRGMRPPLLPGEMIWNKRECAIVPSFFKTDFQSFSNLTGITINNDIEVDHHMDPDQDDGGASTATIVLAVLLALVILAGVAVLLFVQRGWVSSFRLQCCQYCCFRLECCFFFIIFSSKKFDNMISGLLLDGSRQEESQRKTPLDLETKWKLTLRSRQQWGALRQSQGARWEDQCEENLTMFLQGHVQLAIDNDPDQLSWEWEGSSSPTWATSSSSSSASSGF